VTTGDTDRLGGAGSRRGGSGGGERCRRGERERRRS